MERSVVAGGRESSRNSPLRCSLTTDSQGKREKKKERGIKAGGKFISFSNMEKMTVRFRVENWLRAFCAKKIHPGWLSNVVRAQKTVEIGVSEWFIIIRKPNFRKVV